MIQYTTLHYTIRDRRRRPQYGPGEELHLQGHGFGSPGAHVVAALLPAFRGLRAIVLPYQELGSEGVEIVAEAAARYDGRVEFIMLSRNEAGPGTHSKASALLPWLDDFHLRLNAGGG